MTESEADVCRPASSCRHVHLTGILGAGMSALAKLYLEQGYEVSGSDSEQNARFAPLALMGARISIGSSRRIANGVAKVIFSAAVPRDDPELVCARSQGLPTVTRARALSDLLLGQKVIGIAGSHGKTTTTALLAFILERAALRPGYMLGADCPALEGKNARWSDGSFFVNESCEAFRALDFWTPQHCIVTNIDDEHTEHYGGIGNLRTAFADFIERVPAEGRVLLCRECDRLNSIAIGLGDRAETYGFGQDADWRADILKETAEFSEFDVANRGQSIGTVRLAMPGRHTVLNALAALAMSCNLGVRFEDAADVLSQFSGINRRWQHIGSAGGIHLFDDMAHHPTEVAATLSVARKRAGTNGRVIAVFQPQLHSRVSRLAGAFARALGAADDVILLPLDDAGETIHSGNGETSLRAALHAAGVHHRQARTIYDAALIARRLSRADDIVVTIGPDLARKAGPAILASLQEPCDHSVINFCAPKQFAPPIPPPTDLRLQARFEDQVAANPKATCVIERDALWTYQDIDRLASAVAQDLCARGLGRDSLVVISAEKSARLIALVLGTLKAGCAFVPIDPKMMRETLFETLQKVGAALIIRDHDHHFPMASTTASVDLNLFIAAAVAPGTKPPAEPPYPHNGDLAYAIFTSGSTGTPRLVGVEHRNICALLSYSTQALFEPEDLELTPFIDSISFDACIHQIFATLSTGGSLLIEPDLASLMQSERFNRITNLGGTPSVISRLAAMRALPETIRVISLGGEVIPHHLVQVLKASTNVRKIFNLYGPTETTIFSSVARLMDRSDVHSGTDIAGNNIGYPIDGTTLHIIDDQGRIALSGTPGEICISGSGVTRGYLDNPDANAQRFTADHFGMQVGERLYWTGDLGRRCRDGSIEFLGRMDDQLKVNGVRIDPEEIEMHLNAYPDILRAAVISTKDAANLDTLVAFVVTKDETDLSSVRSYLADKLPDVMVPKFIFRIETMALTETGKLKRSDLLEHVPTPVVKTLAPIVLDGVEKRLIAIWQTALHRPDLTADEDFFDSGGDSLASMQMILAAEQEFGIRLSAQALENLGTASDLAAHIRRQMGSPRNVRAAKPELAAQILDKQRAYLAAWKGECDQPDSFVRSLNIRGTNPGLYWCFQGFAELEALAAAFGPQQPVHGMRSGHRIMEYTPDTIAALAHRYCEDMIRMQPSGAFQLGGNCQGATVARATALALRARGRDVSKLILMEQASVWPYDRNVGLIFGRDSSHNPFRTHANPENVFREAYPGTYDVRLVDGGHGSYFRPTNIDSLVHAIRDLTST